MITMDDSSMSLLRVSIFLLFSKCVLSEPFKIYTNDVEDLRASSFPKRFIFGTGSSAYQVEGAWNEGGKGESIWDRIIHTTPSYIQDNSSADVACDSYHRYKEDIKLIKKTGFSMYRISISWPRVLPNGTNDYINSEGLQHYRNVLNELARYNIEPMVTLYHWDLPQALQDMGGWMNETIVEHFQNYARVIFETLGNQVKWWGTINEPKQIARGYSSHNYAPSLGLNGVGDYIAGHNILKAHAKVYRMYEKEFKPTQKGKISLGLSGNFLLPKTDSEEDARAAEQGMQFSLGWFGHPVYSSTGDYPPVMRDIIDRNSLREGRNQSRLPYFTLEEIEEIKGSYDYFSCNHYTTFLGTFGESGLDPSNERDRNVLLDVNPKWPASNCTWLKVYPEGFRKMISWIKAHYGEHIPIAITENGYCDDERLNDFGRVSYYDSYLKELLKAIVEDGANVVAYLAWSFLDNFEWRGGYMRRFGLYHVNFSDPQRPRKRKLSAEYWERFLLQRA
ncbi:unnamed protein product [Nezara viridula]|uniref:Uncharacterized protein n=1 Tax=Nezara viridula TaxID=85310 RepID=A0A9P0H3X6_NEZVI|nr:unnamed protein product [Nezara viridula]